MRLQPLFWRALLVLAVAGAAFVHPTPTSASAPPTISDIPNQVTKKNVRTQPIPFTVSDPDGSVSQLTFTRASSDTTLVPVANIVLSGSGANRTVAVTPAANKIGTVRIDITVRDAQGDTAIDSFELRIIDPPTFSPPVPNQTTPEDTPKTFNITVHSVGQVSAATGGFSLTSSNTFVIPNANIQRTDGNQTATTRTSQVTITPVANRTGTTTITVKFTDTEAEVTTEGEITDTFDFTVTPVNDAPSISNIADQQTNEDQTFGPLNFTVSDIEAGNLTLTATSSNPALVPVANVTFGGSGGNRNVTVKPVANKSGTTTITVTVRDAQARSASDSFVMTFLPLEDPPTISSIADKTTRRNTPTPLIPFTIGDVDTPLANLNVSASSSNTGLVPNANIVLGGSGGNRTVKITPAPDASGQATITISVGDSTHVATEQLVLTVNDPPTISNIGNQTTPEDTPTQPIPYTIGDDLGGVSIVVTSSNQVLVPTSGLILGGGGNFQTLEIRPAGNKTGMSTITVTVTDAFGATASDSFILTVGPVNDPPSISTIDNLKTPRATATEPIPFTVGDAETPPGSLTLTKASSNTALVPLSGIVLGGSGANRTVKVTPAPNQSGTADITLTVRDAQGFQISESFTLTVNDPPTITDVPSGTINEDGSHGPFSFTIGDTETPVASLNLTKNSSNTTLVPLNRITLGGSGASRTATVAPAANQFGEATITLTVSDGISSATDTFTLTVNSVNDPPTISNIPNQTARVGQSKTINYTVGDVESLNELQIQFNSSNDNVMPSENMNPGGSGTNRSVTFTPVLAGTTTITIRVTDEAGAEVTDSFVLTVSN